MMMMMMVFAVMSMIGWGRYDARGGWGLFWGRDTSNGRCLE